MSYEQDPMAIPELKDVPPEDFELVRTALHNEKTPFRTIDGMHEETDVPIAHIISVLRQSDIARVSHLTTNNHETLFVSTEKTLGVREHVTTIRMILEHS